MPRFDKGFALLIFGRENRLAVDGPLDSDSRIVPDVIVSHEGHVSADSRFKFFLVEAFEEEPSVVSEYLGLT